MLAHGHFLASAIATPEKDDWRPLALRQGGPPLINLVNYWLRDSPAAPDDEHLAGADTVGVRLKSQPELHASVGQEFLHLSPSSVELPPQGTYEEIVDTLGKRRPLKTAGDAAGKAAAPLVTPEASDWIASRKP